MSISIRVMNLLDTKILTCIQYLFRTDFILKSYVNFRKKNESLKQNNYRLKLKYAITIINNDT